MAIKQFKPQKYSLAQIEQAKKLYMKFEPTTSIARHTGIPRSTLRYYIRESWQEEREGDARDLVNQIVGARKSQLGEISMLTLDTLLFSIQEIRDSKKVMRTADMLNMAKTLEILDKIALVDKLNNPDGKGNENDDDFIDMEEINDLDPFSPKNLPESSDKKDDKGE